jgi:hypothetical protein
MTAAEEPLIFRACIFVPPPLSRVPKSPRSQSYSLPPRYLLLTECVARRARRRPPAPRSTRGLRDRERGQMCAPTEAPPDPASTRRSLSLPHEARRTLPAPAGIAATPSTPLAPPRTPPSAATPQRARCARRRGSRTLGGRRRERWPSPRRLLRSRWPRSPLGGWAVPTERRSGSGRPSIYCDDQGLWSGCSFACCCRACCCGESPPAPRRLFWRKTTTSTVSTQAGRTTTGTTDKHEAMKGKVETWKLETNRPPATERNRKRMRATPPSSMMRTSARASSRHINPAHAVPPARAPPPPPSS